MRISPAVLTRSGNRFASDLAVSRSDDHAFEEGAHDRSSRSGARVSRHRSESLGGAARPHPRHHGEEDSAIGKALHHR
jgi:hypothetical protein